MTISYTGEVPNGSSFGCFWKILWKWRGSVYKLVWRELLAYLFLYYSINLIYRHALNSHQQRVFEKIRQYFGSSTETIPMSFVLGFYVSLVVKRWWEQYRLLPWPDTLALYISAGIPGDDERGRLMRRNIVRYAVLAYVITLQRVSLRVKRRFPTWQHVVDCGLMLESEKKIIERMDGKSPMSKYWMPLVWATNIINRARKESLITSDHIVQTLLMELSDIRRRLGGIIGYDTVCVPLVYTQVVTLALYTYFIASLMGRQFVLHQDENGKLIEPDMYFPFFTALQFCFYVGWLKVAEVLINPFGEDDDDIELNWLIDRHIKAAYMIVDEMHEEHPELLKDQYWDEVVPKDLPYTVASEHYRREEPKGSAEKYKVKEADAVYANLIPSRKVMHDDMYADYESVDTPLVERRKNWFARQITRMGSVRSASTAYSSGGLFGRNRHNSVYSSPDAGIPPGGLPGPGQVLPHKMTLYDRIVGRKSGRGQFRQPRTSTVKINGSAVPVTLKNRPRIPTPDVTKEVVDRENRLAAAANSLQNQNAISQGVALMAQQLSQGHAAAYPNYPGTDLPVVQVVLSPIQELDGGSHNNTLHASSPGTAALAQTVLSPTLGAAGIPSVITPVTVATMPSVTLTPVTMSQLGLHTSSSSPQITNVTFVAPSPALSDRNEHGTFELATGQVTLTEVPSGSEEEATSATSESSQGSTLEDKSDRSRKTSTASQNTIPATNNNSNNNNNNNSSSGKKREVYV
ncbi:bestrophin-2 [Chrysoperla carnea]|uniref:bestrophin-2 n=1 Tax=Chrysoperla carnea TaxID=189513 RepID=UPI001D0981B0|nr:bestrophin-2 [Chrysoperla carnea]